MKIAIVILNWNGLELLKKFLPSVISNTLQDATIYIADNGSEDGSIEWIRNNHPEIILIDNKSNYGFAEGYNRALKSIDSEYYVLLNSDVEVVKNWTYPVIQYMDGNPEVAACQPKILSYADKGKFEHAGAAGGFIDKYGYPFCRGRVFNHIESDDNQYNTVTDIFWASGACLFIRSEAWKIAGGFDSDFFAHMEEIDLCWRLLSLDFKIKYIPESTVYHLGGGTLSYNSPAKIYYNFRNNLFILHKNLPERKFRAIIVKRMILDGIAGLRFILYLNLTAFWQVFRSHIAYYKSIPALNRKRRAIVKDGHSYPEELILNKSLVMDFYIRKRKVFSEIFKEK
jgi:GT2 family glycosyltransferase